MKNIFSRKREKIGEIQHFSLKYTQGNQRDGVLGCSLELQSEGYVAIFEDMGKATVATVSEEFVRILEEILKTCGADKWRGYCKRGRSTADGDSFHLQVSFRDAVSLHAQGHICRPKGFSVFVQQTRTLFRNHCG